MILNPMLGMPQGAEWLVILLIVIVVFGAAKLPELARSTGQALKIFKSETKGLRDDDTSEGTSADLPPTAELPPSSGQAPTTPVQPTEVSEPRRDTSS